MLHTPESAEEASHIIESGKTRLVIITPDKRVFHIPRQTVEVSKLEQEREQLARLGKALPVHVPQMLGIQHTADNGFRIEYEKARGTELTPALIAAMSVAEKKLLGQDIGAFFSALHAMPPVGFHRRPLIDIRDDKEQYLRHAASHLSTEEQEYIETIFAEAIPAFEGEVPETLIQWDFGMQHVFTEKGRLSAVIDWGAARITDPAMDWKWGLGPRGLDPVIFKTALSHYKAVTPTDAGFDTRVRYYNERKAIKGLFNPSDDFTASRKRLYQAMEAKVFP